MYSKRASLILLSSLLPFIIAVAFLSPLISGHKSASTLKITEKSTIIASNEAGTFPPIVEGTKRPLIDTVANLPITNAEPLPQISESLSESVERLQFVENVGQFDEQVRFWVRGAPGNIHFTADAVWFTFWSETGEDSFQCLHPSFVAGNSENCSDEREGVVLKWSFEGANPNPDIVAFAPQDITLSYFLGNDPEHWAANVPVYSGIRYEDVYPGIDIEYTSDDEGYWQPRVIAEANADLSLVSLKIEGATSEQVSEGQTLLLDTTIGSIELPLLQLEGAEETNLLASPTVVHHIIKSPFASSASRRQQGSNSESQLRYSTYIGGNGPDYAVDVVMDEVGNSYVLLEALSSNLVTTPGTISYVGTIDAYIAKLDADNNLIFATYLGSNGPDNPYSLEVDGNQDVYVSGDSG